MRSLLIITLLCLIFSCNSESSKTKDKIYTKKTSLKTTSTKKNEIETNYYFIGIAIDEPVSWKTTYENGERIMKVKRETSFYTSKIKSYDGHVSEDLKYQWLDIAESNVKNTFENNVSKITNESRITVFRELYKFDSYTEASLKLQKIARGEYSREWNMTGEMKFVF